MMDEKKLITKTGLKERGWTDSIIKNHFPVPTEERENPNYRKGPTMKLYDLEQVKAIEAMDQFKVDMAKAEVRRKGGKKGANVRRVKTLDWVKALPAPDIPVIPLEELKKLALQHYNQRALERQQYDMVNADWDESQIHRHQVNHLRHMMSDYERCLRESRGRVGVKEAEYLITIRVFEAIAERYPDLANECRSQINRRGYTIFNSPLMG